MNSSQSLPTKFKSLKTNFPLEAVALRSPLTESSADYELILRILVLSLVITWPLLSFTSKMSGYSIHYPLIRLYESYVVPIWNGYDPTVSPYPLSA